MGYCSVGKPPKNTKPTMTMKMAITMATIGRRTKKLPMLAYNSSKAGGWTAARVALTCMPPVTFCRPS